MTLKITFTTAGRKDLRKHLRVGINGMPDEAVKGSMYEVLEYLTGIGFPEEEIVRLGTEFTQVGHTILETDRITEADIRRGALEPEEDTGRAVIRGAQEQLRPEALTERLACA
jgi:hypothetical protein